jgi:hypothetical protein
MQACSPDLLGLAALWLLFAIVAMRRCKPFPGHLPNKGKFVWAGVEEICNMPCATNPCHSEKSSGCIY